MEPNRGVYKKVIARDGRVAGAILLGDGSTAPRLLQAFDRSEVLPQNRAELLFPLSADGVATPDVWRELKMPSGHTYTKTFRTCKTCVGTDFCRYGAGNSVKLGIGHLRSVPLDESEGICERLDAEIQSVVDAYKDPWLEAEISVHPNQFVSVASGG